MDAERVAVIVGAGQINDRPADPAQGLDAMGLMHAALVAADRDAGGGWLADLQSLGIVQQISFRRDNPVAPKLAAKPGLAYGIAYESVGPNGDRTTLLPAQAANRIRRRPVPAPRRARRGAPGAPAPGGPRPTRPPP